MKRINIRESLLNMDRETDCKYDLTSLYESVKLDDEKKKQLCQYIDKVDIDATNRFLSNEASSQGLMENASDDISDDQLQEWYDEENDWKELACKRVEDSDGFMTEYTLYSNADGDKFICMFGDRDFYPADADYADFEAENEREAWEWFNSYNGFEDEEELSTDELLDSLNEDNEFRNVEITAGMTQEYEIIRTNAPDEIIVQQLKANSDDQENLIQVQNPYAFIESKGYEVEVLGSQDDFDDESKPSVDASFDYYDLNNQSLNESTLTINDFINDLEDTYNEDVIETGDEDYDCDSRSDNYEAHIEVLKDIASQYDAEFDNLTHTICSKIDDMVSKDFTYKQIIDELINDAKSESLNESSEETVKDYVGTKIYRVARKYGFKDNFKLMNEINNDPEFVELCAKYKDILWSAPSAVEKIVSKYLPIEESLNEATVNYVDKYNNYNIYECDGKFIANVSDSKLGSKRLTASSIDELKVQIDEADKEYSDYYHNLPESLNESWIDAYEQFNAAVDEHFPDGVAIELAVEELYNQHKGEPDWDEAWRRWTEDNDIIEEDIDEDGVTTVTFTFDPSQWNGNPNNLEDYFEYSPDQLTFNPSTVDGPTQVELTGSLRYINDFKSKYSNLFESITEEEDLMSWFNDANNDVIDAGWTTSGEVVVILNNNAPDIEEVASDLTRCIQNNNYHVIDWNVNGSNVFIFEVIHNDDYNNLANESLNENVSMFDFRLDPKTFKNDGSKIEANTTDDILDICGPATQEYLPKEFKFINIQNHACLTKADEDALVNNIIDEFSNAMPLGNRKVKPMYEPFGLHSPNPTEVRIFSRPTEDENAAYELYQRTCNLMHLNDVADEETDNYISKGDLDYGCALVNQMRKGVKVYRVVARWMLISDNELENTLIKINDYNSQLNESVSKQTLDEGWFSDDDFEDDMMHTDLYGGDPMYCRTCGSKIDYSDGYGFCPQCNPQYDELEEGVGEVDLIDALDIDTARFYVYDAEDNVVSDEFEWFNDAIDFADENNYPVVKVHRYVRDFSNADWFVGDEDGGRIYHGEDAAYKAFTELSETNEDTIMEPVEGEEGKLQPDGDPVVVYKDGEVIKKTYTTESLDESKNVGIAFDAEAPEEYSESEIEDTVTKALDKTPVNVSGYMEVHSLDEDLEGDLDKRYRPSSISSRQLEKLTNSDLVKDVQVVTMYDNEVVKLTSVDGRVFFLVPSTLSQFDVYDEQESLVATNLFTSEIPNELLETGEPNYIYQVVGGDYAGTYSREELEALPCFSGEYTKETRTVRSELANQPILDGYLSPMFNGWRENHTACIRYETQEVYNMLSEDGKNLSSKKGTLGNLIASNNDLLKTFSTKEEIINFLLDIEPQCTDKKYLNQIKMKAIHAKNFFDAYKLLYNAMLKGDGLGSIEKEIRGTKKFAYESLEESTKTIKCPVNGLYDGKEDNCFYFKDGQCTLPRDGGNPGEECKEYIEWERTHSLIEDEQETSEEDDIKELEQEFSSKDTSINSSKLPAVFKLVHFNPGTINLDYGGGKFDNVAEYLAQDDVTNLVYDPFNRSQEHNKEVIATVRNNGGADTVTCSNVLNVIKEPEVRLNVLSNIKKLVKPNGTVYITVYEGSGVNQGGATKSGYQLNRKTADYLDEIQQVFPDAKRKGKLIIATPNGKAVEESLTESSDENWAVFATDVESGKEYCAGVYESEDYAGYWAAQDRAADVEFDYGDFKYRVEQVPEYTNDMVQSQRELNSLKISNHEASQEELRRAFDEE